MKIEVEIKKMQTGFANILVKGHLKLEAIKEECFRSREKESREGREDKKIRGALQVCSLIILGVLILYPEYGLAGITDIADIKTLTKKVQDDSQGYLIPMVLNAAGIETAGFALISQRWTMLMFGAAYLIFVNVFFGFVNGSFKVN
jgi:hypothetical protein